ncbi:hypothetical protein SISSUDRAFT_351314 [Sistotremastrum suecicum HHB10207 ss-3]|uniref:Uncharacterized protein n=1 Tax=Sistotremastrum suecicum HHB10207 ss-3 TaxID=1314776 RepID=A0A166G2Q4_9AGAM|nr:hypothetical protein SISSUDRAFT_351314 [Sistotremastrum suecicum HHB10207 ss-3]
MSAQHVTSNTNGRHSGTPASVPSIKVDNGTPIEQSAPPPKLEALASYLARPSLPLSRSNSFSGLAHLESKKNIILKSHGRPPWCALDEPSPGLCCLTESYRYGEDGQRVSDAFVIGIAGGSASGKVCLTSSQF